VLETSGAAFHELRRGGRSYAFRPLTIE
jgi:hypothetical protein